MKYYSEKLDKLFDTEKDLKAEEHKVENLALEKENRRKEVEEAGKKYSELLKAYCDDYGTFSTSANDLFSFIFSNRF